jgi:NAD(P)-dependent dehydrogenase (short-subunit alcohol dehydrogenase family)
MGKTFALALAKEGANVVVSDINVSEAKLVSEEIKKLGS